MKSVHQETIRFSLEVISNYHFLFEIDSIVYFRDAVIFDTPMGPNEGMEPGGFELVDCQLTITDAETGELISQGEHVPDDKLMNEIRKYAFAKACGDSYKIKIFNHVFGPEKKR